ncbi:SMI1/KNR4 family protein [Nonomuraea sp. NPDC059194]|uniref:SMI1/KNR4 family protein n=1 Tax=Nonomuraea sp. NPDC059194 TaxID=3346764 RepID=UPI0036BF5A3A
MRRLITSRGLWLAVSAAVVAAAIVVIARSRRRPAERRPVQPPVQAESGPGSQWPPVPVLGAPTAADLERYIAKPSVFDGVVEEDVPREPLDKATRRRLTRWGMAGLALLLLAVGAQALESAVFSKEPAGEATVYLYQHELQDVPCAETSSDGHDACLSVAIERQSAPNGDRFPQSDYGEEPQERPHPDSDCLPRTATPQVRKINAKVTRAVDRQWRRIEAWLKSNAPRSYRTLGKPGNAKAIAEAEAQMGLLFPDDLRASLLRHDGAVFVKDVWGFGFLGNSNSSVQEIRGTWRALCEIEGEDYVAEGLTPRTEWWDGRMIPIGANGSGDHLVIDSVRRDVGRTDHEGSMSFTPGGVRIRSYYALLKATADAMERGGSVGYWKPKAELR